MDVPNSEHIKHLASTSCKSNELTISFLDHPQHRSEHVKLSTDVACDVTCWNVALACWRSFRVSARLVFKRSGK